MVLLRIPELGLPSMAAFSPVPRIETTGCFLASWGVGDVVGLDEALRESREQLLPWMPWAAEEPLDLEARLTRIQDWRDASREGRDFFYGLFHPQGGVLGALGLHPRVGPGALEIGYWVRTSATGRGLATRAAAAAARVALEIMGAERVEIRVAAENHASIRIPRKLGFHEIAPPEPSPTTGGLPQLVFQLKKCELSSSPVGRTPLRAFDEAGRAMLPKGQEESGL